MKSRTKNQTSIKEVSQPKSTTKKEFVETEQNLVLLLKEYEEKLKQADFKVERLFDLLSRNSSKRWTEKKKKKMQQHYATAQEDLSFAKLAVDQVSFRLSQVQIEKKQNV